MDAGVNAGVDMGVGAGADAGVGADAGAIADQSTDLRFPYIASRQTPSWMHS